MKTESVPLRFSTPDGRAVLRELTGFDEYGVTGCSTSTAIQLLDNLLVNEPPHAASPGSASGLTATDRDLLLAAVYRATYGDIIRSTISCSECGELFDLDFSLNELERRLRNGVDQSTVVLLDDGTFRLPAGKRFRLLSGVDECNAAHLYQDEGEKLLIARCLLDGDNEADSDAIQEAMEHIAPTMDVDLDASCPECECIHQVQFDIQNFLLQSLVQERTRLTADVHSLASAYGWGLDEILSLTRSDRRSLVTLIQDGRLEGERVPR